MSDKNDFRNSGDKQKDNRVNEKISAADLRRQLVAHPIYAKIMQPEEIKVFMQHHIFAVWDFMTLLKRLQLDLTCVALPWRPKLSPTETKYARFINEIVLGEETDTDGANRAISHFDLYLQAMRECGADTAPIENFLNQLEITGDAGQSLEKVELPQTVKDFVVFTLQTALQGKTHEVCAAFFYGREEIIPDMFQAMVDELEKRGQTADRLLYYLKRHVELDGNEHGPLAAELLKFLCGDDSAKKDEVEKIAVASLKMRLKLWDGVLAEIQNSIRTQTAAGG